MNYPQTTINTSSKSKHHVFTTPKVQGISDQTNLKHKLHTEQFSSPQVAIRNPQLKEQTLKGSPALYVVTTILLRRLSIMSQLLLTLQSVHLKYAVK